MSALLSLTEAVARHIRDGDVVAMEELQEQCGWELKFAADLTEPPTATADELGVLRELQARTAAAHGSDA